MGLIGDRPRKRILFSRVSAKKKEGILSAKTGVLLRKTPIFCAARAAIERHSNRFLPEGDAAL